MAIPLLKTKLHIPSIRSKLVLRTRLLERLDAGLEKKLTLISAPAGFGKTTLLSAWIKKVDRPVAWVSLDDGDNDPTRFWSYVVAALQTIDPDIGQAVLSALQSPQQIHIEQLLTGLINDIVDAAQRLILILDDLHVITATQVYKGLSFLLDHLPSAQYGLHLVVATRMDPPWPLARLRVRRELTELRALDLRFTEQEIATFFHNSAGIDLSPENIAGLNKRTEGWIAGLQMASLALQGQERTQNTDGATQFIATFGGSHRFVLDYLVEEVLAWQPPLVREFLLKTSILKRLTAPLCDAVRFGYTETPHHSVGAASSEGTAAQFGETEPPGPFQETDPAGEGSQAILVRLEQANLFLTPLDDERRWYRYHPLFADLLRRQLAQTYPEQVSRLNQRASEWHQAQDLIPEAIGYALSANDVERVANLVENVALHVMDGGELSTLLGWLDKLPDPVLRSRPWLCLARGWAFAFSGQLDAAESSLQDAENALHRLADRKQEQKRIRGHIAAVRVYIAEIGDDVSKAIELGRQTLNHLGQDEPRLRAFTAIRLGNALAWTSNLDEAIAAFEIASKSGQTAGDAALTVNALSETAMLRFIQGKLELALALFHQALDLAEMRAEKRGRPILPIGLTYLQLGALYYELNELETAMRYTQTGMTRCKRWGEKNALFNAHLNRARILQAMGRQDDAFQAIEKASQIAASLSPASLAYIMGWHVIMRLRLGDVEFASAWAEERKIKVDDTFDAGQQFEYAAFAQLLIAQARFDDATTVLRRLLADAERARSTRRVIRYLILQAIAFQGQQKHHKALSTLQRALTLAEPSGFVRIFVDEGKSVERLLRQALQHGIALEYTNKLLAAFAQHPDTPTSRGPHDKAMVEPLVEPLSDRELQILRLLTTDLSSTEIARELFISKNTVRSHIKNLYEKLGVHSRAEAIERAQALNLL